MQKNNREKGANRALSLYQVMTDELCSEEGCPVPIMRSKDGAIKFCVNHDPLPTSNSRNTKKIPSVPAPATPEAEGDDGAIEQPSPSTSGSDEIRLQQERREQSSKASQLIGQRMLQRWVLLNETCPNGACFAVSPPPQRESDVLTHIK
jgi:uncharacterized Zn finger protein (UPF0148 family)